MTGAGGSKTRFARSPLSSLLVSSLAGVVIGIFFRDIELRVL